MTLSMPWLCCLLLHIPQSIAPVFYLPNKYLPLLSLAVSVTESAVRRMREICENAMLSVSRQLCTDFCSLSHPVRVSLHFFLGYFLQKNKSVIVSHSLLISLFKFSLQMLSWAEQPKLSSPPDMTRYSPALLDLALLIPMRTGTGNVRIQLRGNTVLTLIWTSKQTRHVFNYKKLQ